MKRAQDKVVIITGGASGIGRVASLRFAAEGAAVIIWDINLAQAQAVCETAFLFCSKRSAISVRGGAWTAPKSKFFPCRRYEARIVSSGS